MVPGVAIFLFIVVSLIFVPLALVDKKKPLHPFRLYLRGTPVRALPGARLSQYRISDRQPKQWTCQRGHVAENLRD